MRAFNPLFKSEDPSAHPEGFLADINPDSEQIYHDAFLETGFHEVRRTAPWPRELRPADSGEGDAATTKKPTPPYSIRFQGMRVAYFAVDRDSTDEHVVLNRIVTLKDTAGKT